MNSRVLRRFAVGGVVMATLMVGIPESKACGSDDGPPLNHFPFCSEQGNFSYWQSIGQIDLDGKGLERLPLIINFNSGRGGNSLLGSGGWRLFPIEANVYQLDERLFKLTKPNGGFLLFWRDKQDPNLLHGQSGYKAEVKDDTISAVAPCGTRLDFVKGKLMSIHLPPKKSDVTVSGRRIDVVYTGGRPSGLREGGQEKLSVEYDSVTGEAKALVFNRRRIEIQQDQKPQVQVVNGQNVIGRMERSLSRLILPGASTNHYLFSVNDRLDPTLEVNGRKWVWSAATRLITSDSDGNWAYDIKPNEKDPLVANAAIGRKNDKEQSEFWHYDGAHGREIVEEGSIRTTRTWFTSGILAGKLRKVEEMVNGKSTVIQKLAYDEKGKLLRNVDRLGNIESFTYKDGKRISSKDPTPEQLAEEEKQWMKKIAKAETPDAKEDSLYELGLFYANKLSIPSKARDMALLITNPQKRFHVLLHSYDHNEKLSPSEKIQFYKQLLTAYPEQKKILTELIEMRKKEKI